MSHPSVPEISLEKGRSESNGRNLTMVILLFLVIVALAVAANPLTNGVFFKITNLTNIMKQWPSQGYGLIAIGMLFVILTGGIDLSVGSVLSFSGTVAALLSLDYGWPVWLCMLVGIASGVFWGAVNGFLVARFDLAPFVVTLATMTTIRGLCQVLSDVAVRPTDPAFPGVTKFNLFGSIPSGMLALILVVVLATVFLNRTPLGRSTIAIGGNRETVRLAGISVNRGIMTAYMISGLCAGMAGVIFASRSGQIQPSGAGLAFELDAIAACVIGGASLMGGKGNIRGMLAGMVVLILMNNILSLRSVQPFYQQVLKGVIIILVILIQSRSRHRE